MPITLTTCSSTELHAELDIFPVLLLQPYAITILNSRYIRTGVLSVGLFIGQYIFSKASIRKVVWPERLKCQYNVKADVNVP